MLLVLNKRNSSSSHSQLSVLLFLWYYIFRIDCQRCSFSLRFNCYNSLYYVWTITFFLLLCLCVVVFSWHWGFFFRYLWRREEFHRQRLRKGIYTFFKVRLSPSKKIYLLQWWPFKSDEKCVLFDLKTSFRS